MDMRIVMMDRKIDEYRRQEQKIEIVEEKRDKSIMKRGWKVLRVGVKRSREIKRQYRENREKREKQRLQRVWKGWIESYTKYKRVNRQINGYDSRMMKQYMMGWSGLIRDNRMIREY